MELRQILNETKYVVKNGKVHISKEDFKKIHKDYNIVWKDFYNSEYELSSFDKWIKDIYDKDIIAILDNSSNYESAFERFRSNILCKAKKITTLEGLSENCERNSWVC